MLSGIILYVFCCNFTSCLELLKNTRGNYQATQSRKSMRWSRTKRESSLHISPSYMQSLLHHKVNKDKEDINFRDERDENESFIFML